jgi:phage shock protein A
MRAGNQKRVSRRALALGAQREELVDLTAQIDRAREVLAELRSQLAEAKQQHDQIEASEKVNGRSRSYV